MELREAVLETIKHIPGGWNAAAGALGMSPTTLRQRAYETKGWVLHTDHKLTLQELAGRDFIIEALCAASGGTFVKLPELDAIENDSIHVLFNQSYAEIGSLFNTFTAAVEDGVIDDRERAALEAHGQALHRKVEQLLALTFSVYCRHTNTVKLAPASTREAEAA